MTLEKELPTRLFLAHHIPTADSENRSSRGSRRQLFTWQRHGLGDRESRCSDLPGFQTIAKAVHYDRLGWASGACLSISMSVLHNSNSCHLLSADLCQAAAKDSMGSI